MTDEAWAKSLLKGIEEVRRKASKDEKSTAAYWNGDGWGSISGIRDADEWVERQVVDYVLRRVKSKMEKVS